MHPETTSEPEGRLGLLYRALWQHAGRDRRLVAAYVALLVGAQFARLAVPYFTGLAVDAVQAGGESALAAAAWDMAAIFAACVVAWALHGPGRIVERIVALRVRERYAAALTEGILARPLRWHEQRHSGETAARVQKSASALHGFAQHQFIYLQNFVSLVGPVVAIAVVSAATGAAALVGYVLIGFVLLRFDRLMRRLAAAQNAADARHAATLHDALGNFASVLALRLEAAVGRRVAERLEAVGIPLRRSIVANEAKWCVIDLLNNALRCGLAVLFAYLAWRESGSLLLGAAVMVFQYAQQAGSVVSSMASHWGDLQKSASDFAMARGLVAPQPAPPVTPAERWTRLVIGRLAFRYGEGAAVGVEAMTIRRGARIALVGESGSGKSTLLRLLAGLYEPDGGALALDAAPATPAQLRAIATLVPQTPEVFEATVRENLTLSGEADPPAIAAAVEAAELRCVVDALPHGLETRLGERGHNLSGGQKQRVALARALLAAAPGGLLLLDEPTSSLDAETEARLYDKVFAMFPEAAIVSSIHRLHLLRRFDEVFVFANGRIVRHCTPSAFFCVETPAALAA
jgi:ABC-type multidrug transport system fused ATPase/permease subunit